VSSRRERAWSVGQIAFCWLWGLTPVALAMTRLRRAIRSSSGDPLIEANLLAFLAVAEMMAGSPERAHEDMARARAMTRDLGLTWQVGFHSLLAADLERLAGAYDVAVRDAEFAMAIMLEQGDRWDASVAAVDLAGVLVSVGRADEALDRLAEADRTPVPHDIEWWLKRRMVGGRALARIGRVDEGEMLAREAVTTIARTDYGAHFGTAWLSLAEVLESAGRFDDAVAAADEARRRYETKGDRSSATRAADVATRLAD
jgi:tetratricopeptide (TPR) repeat protein